MLELYKNIKKRRLELNMTQDELAAKTGYAGKSMITKVEAGHVDLPLSKIEVFAEALKTTPGALMGWKVTMESGGLPPGKAHIIPKVDLENSEKRLLRYYRDLSEAGKEKILTDVSEMSEDPMWQSTERLNLYYNALKKRGLIKD